MQQLDAPGLKPADYDVMVVGDEFGPLELLVDDALVRDFAYAVDDLNPWYLERSPFGGRIAPATMLANEVLGLWTTKYDASTDKGLHAWQELRLLAPVTVGQRVIARSRFVDKFMKRDMPYVATEGEVVAADDGRPLVWFRCTEMVGMQPGVEVGAGKAAAQNGGASRPRPRADRRLPVVRRAHADAPIGSPLPTLTKRVSLKQMTVFSARESNWRNMHTDHAVARSIGLDGAIAQALMTTGYLSELCTGFFQDAWFNGGWTSMAFLRPIPAGQILLATGAVRGTTEGPDGRRLELDVWCEDPEGNLITVGQASAAVE